MRRRIFCVLGLIGCAVALAGCLHARPVTPPPSDFKPEIGQDHRPYRGRPAYLASNGPLLPRPASNAATQQNCAVRSRACEDRLRALLAAVDAHLAALGAGPGGGAGVRLADAKALTLSVAELRDLLGPYPDMRAEAEELADWSARLPSLPPAEVGRARARMLELADLLRVQLAAAD